MLGCILESSKHGNRFRLQKKGKSKFSLVFLIYNVIKKHQIRPNFNGRTVDYNED